jgi:rhamnogalacturonan II specific xylosyltransferase
MHYRTVIVGKILEMGFNVLVADIDSVWMKDPFPAIFIEANRMYDIIAQNDKWKDGNNLCGGFLLLRSKPHVLELWNELIRKHAQMLKDVNGTLRNGDTEQHMLNKLVRGRFSNVVPYKFLSQHEFPDGDTYRSSAVMGARLSPIVIHNNYIVGHDAKVKRFIEWKLWMANNRTGGCSQAVCSFA